MAMTNFEAVDALERTGRDVFTGAWRRETTEGFPSDYENQPLSAISLCVSLTLPPTELGPADTAHQALTLYVADPTPEDHPRWRFNPHQRVVRNTVLGVLGSTLSRDLEPGHISSGVIAVTYKAYLAGETDPLRVSSTDARPSMVHMAAALNFGELALHFIRGKFFKADISERLSFRNQPGLSKADLTDSRMRYNWDLAVQPGGHTSEL